MIVDYQIANITNLGYYYADDLIQIAPNITFEKLILPIVKIEAPIQITECYTRAIKSIAIQRLGNRLNAYFDKVVKYGVKTGAIIKRGDFLYIPQNNIVMRNRKYALPRIEIEKICPEEIKLFALYVINNEFGIDEDSLVNKVAKEIGFNRITDNIFYTIKPIISSLAEHKTIKYEDGKYSLI